MRSEDPETKSEIIIVRRSRNDGEEEHHGGVWKIAYADFMTAMMAFFLVMWLINAASEETKAAVASYFNPLQLVDTRSRARGIENIPASMLSDEGTENTEGKEKRAPAEDLENKGKNVSEIIGMDEENQLMALPYRALDVIANNKLSNIMYYEGQGGASEGGSQSGSAKGTAYRDPFSPEYWNKNQTLDILPAVGDVDRPVANHDSIGKAGQVEMAGIHMQPMQDKLAAENKAAGQKITETETADGQQAPPVKQVPETILAEEISSDLAMLLQKEAVSSAGQPLVRVTPAENGVAIELTDSQSYGMFAIGSAKPDKQLIALLEGVARILQKHKGEVVISGHTDARPYKTMHYDNWQLSSARAQMAYYMLVRGGMDEKRVLRVEGYADRDLKNSEDPEAAENRRISIFLKVPKAEAH